MRTGHRGTPPAGRPAGGRGAAQAAPGRTASGDRAARRWAAAAGGPLGGAAATIPLATAAPLVFTPGSLRLLANLVATLRSAPPPAPEACDAPRHQPTAAAPAAVEHLPARAPPAAGRARGRPAAAADPDPPGAGTRAAGTMP